MSSFLDSLRQLYLLLWKNYTLRKRKKFRFISEIILPLCFFLILMWVRTRGLRSRESQCHFSERPLPSAGLLPFIRGYLCQLNNQCYLTPRSTYSNENLFKLLEISNEFLSITTNKPDVWNTLKHVTELSDLFAIERDKAADLTRSIQLKDVSTSDDFIQKVTSITNNQTITNLILNSNPNFNYLYSNYSSTYYEPLLLLSIANVQQSIINIFYGSELDLIDLNRDTNQVYNPLWIRQQNCFSSNNLLRLNDSDLNSFLCSNLNDEQLVQLFTLISEEIDWTVTKQKVSQNFNNKLFENGLKLAQSTSKIQKEFKNSKILSQNDLNSITKLIGQLKLSDLCGSDSSQLSVFGAFDGVNSSTILRPDQFTNLIAALKDNKINLTAITQSIISQDGILASITSDDFTSTEYNNRPKSFKSGQSEFKRLNKRPNFKRRSVDQAPNETSIIPTLTELLEAANNLNNLNDSQCPAKIKSTEYDTTTKSCLCHTIYFLISDVSTGTQTLFNQLKPMLLGKIVYAPDTIAYRSVIKRMNETFETIEQIANVLNNLGDLTQHSADLLNQYSALLQANWDLMQSEFNLTNFNVKETIIQLKFSTQLLYFTRNFIKCFELNKFIGLKSEEKAIEAAEQLAESDSFYAAVIFTSNETITDNELPKVVQYKIRMNSTQTHDTLFTQDRFYNFNPSNCLGCNKYFLYGFIYIQDMLEKSLIEIKTNQTVKFGVTAQMTSYPCYVNDKFMIAISRLLPGFMVLSWVYTVSMIVKDIVYEKEKRLKEFMRVMGLTNATHWAAWFITSFILMFSVSCILCCIIKYGKVTQYSDITVLMFFYCCFTIATITQCFLISVFFNQANLAAVVAGMIYYLFYLPYTILVNYSDVLETWHKFLASMSSTVAFGYGFEIIATFELQNIGAQWSNFNSSPYSMRNSFSMGTICLIMLFDACVYMFLAWYIETVAPGEFGIPKPWYFLFTTSYWTGNYAQVDKKSFINKIFKNWFYDSKEKIILDEEKLHESLLNQLDNSVELIENECDLTAGIEINKLNKVYTRGNNHALKGLTLKFYQNEITAFLGHNGAGKSTTMHLLTGLYRPTTGSAFINGLSISNSMNQIRKSLGFVPQHNILFPLMSVQEHLWFYARLKGLDKQSTLDETERMLADTGLENKRHEESKNLSGGMQRKLSVAIAFVGGSKTVILDEPSAGIDPQGRRSIWDLLFKYRIGRTIIISTHHMDEADVLGDRIAIISNGKLIAHGTSYFLKNKFGRGYYLTFAKKAQEDSLTNISNETNETDDTRQSAAINVETEPDNERLTLKSQTDLNIHEFVKQRFTDAILVENIGTEMTYSISNKKEFTVSYEAYFKQIETNMDRLGIDSMGISDTTLEEIFIRLAKEPMSNSFQDRTYKLCGLNVSTLLNKLKKSKTKTIKTSDEQLKLYSTYTKLRVQSHLLLILVQLYALLIKRFQRVKRNVKGFFAEIVLPVVFVCMALLVATLTPKPGERLPLELHPWHYSEPNQIFLSKSSAVNFDSIGAKVQTNLNEIDKITDTFFQSGSLGTRCMKDYRIKMTPQSQLYSRVTADEQFFSCETNDYLNITESSQPISLVNQLKAVNFSSTKISPDCNCTRGFPACSIAAGGDINYRVKMKLKTKDILYDLTSRNISDWLIKTEFSNQFFRRRFGGFEFLVPNQNDINQMTEQTFNNFNKVINLLTNTFNQLNRVSSAQQLTNSLLVSKQNVKVWYNLKGYDTSVSYLNVINNAILRSQITVQSNQSADSAEFGIVAFNHPMPNAKSQFMDKLEMQAVIDLFVAICMIFSLSFIPASFLVFLLEERETHSKQLQIVSGIKPYLYWISNFIWDLFNYIVPCLLCILVFVLFDVKAFMSKENFPCLVVLMLLYGWSCIPLMYPLNYVFKVPSTAFVFSSSTNVFIGTVTTIATAVLTQLGNDEPDLLKINDIIKPIFLILFPHYCLGQGFITMSLLYNVAEVQRSFGIKAEYNPFEFNNNGKNLIAMFFQGIVYFTLNLLIEYKFFIRFKPSEDLAEIENGVEAVQDEDVANERKRILESTKQTETCDTDYIKLINMTKVYKKFDFKKFKFNKHVAVKKLTLGINKGECFGLIGVNGAGKTTSFKMITGEIPITAGDVTVGGFSVSKDIENVHKNIGYCPQFDALMPLLTAKEHLIFFARLRGIPERYVEQVSDWAMNRVGLSIFADRISGDYSGGNKRKLSTAIALVGDPSVICLDEPTSGMDAKARRLLWNDILSLIKENRIVILTSHTMEECEALCTRLVIMVNGEFKCLGSLQHLKSKFGNGYKLAVRLDDENNKENFFQFMTSNFPQSIILETHRNLFEFILPFNEHTKLSQIFGKIEKNRMCLKIKDYSVSQSTLDQIFVNFAKAQNEDV